MIGRLSSSQKAELLLLLSSVNPHQYKQLQRGVADRLLKAVLDFYTPISKAAEEKIWKRVKAERGREEGVQMLPPDEHVEDAGLYEDDTSRIEIPAGASESVAV